MKLGIIAGVIITVLIVGYYVYFDDGDNKLAVTINTVEKSKNNILEKLIDNTAADEPQLTKQVKAQIQAIQ